MECAFPDRWQRPSRSGSDSDTPRVEFGVDATTWYEELLDLLVLWLLLLFLAEEEDILMGDLQALLLRRHGKNVPLYGVLR